MTDLARDLAALPTPLRPATLAHERLIEVVEPLRSLLPQGGLRRGSIVATSGTAATSLALALAAAASSSGSWVAAVGLPAVGIAAAGELGIALERWFLVAEPPVRQWAEITSIAAEGADVVLARAPGQLSAGEVRRLQAKLQARGAVLVLVGEARAISPEVELVGEPIGWEGIGAGHGRLLARRVRVERTGRRAGRPERRELWLPGPDGGITDAGVSAVPLHPAAG